jgi:hypothetical protein
LLKKSLENSSIGIIGLMVLLLSLQFNEIALLLAQVLGFILGTH